MRRKTPTCNKCGKDHYGFIDCAAHRNATEPKQPPIFWREENTVGFREWGDRLDTFTRSGNTLWLNPNREREGDGEEEG